MTRPDYGYMNVGKHVYTIEEVDGFCSPSPLGRQCYHVQECPRCSSDNTCYCLASSNKEVNTIEVGTEQVSLGFWFCKDCNLAWEYVYCGIDEDLLKEEQQ